MVKDFTSGEQSRPPKQEPSTRAARGGASGGTGSSPRRTNTSPYSRTGLFPWGNTYDVPAQHEGPWVLSQTPCHLRTVRIPADQDDARHTVRCAACGRAWTLSVNTETTPLTATWTA